MIITGQGEILETILWGAIAIKLLDSLYNIPTRKYMHAETLALLTKQIVFSEHEVSKVVVMVTR